MTDSEAVANYGTVALNVTGSYFSEYKVPNNLSGTLQGIPHYEDWVIRELAERLQNKREFTIKTHRGLFNSRVGAKVQITVKSEQLAGEIASLVYRYKRDTAFVASFKISEGVINEGQ
jgi:hypothetical protein